MIFSTEWLACIPTAGLRKVWQSGNWEEAEIPLVLLMVFCPQPQDVRLRGYTAGPRSGALENKGDSGAAPQPSTHAQLPPRPAILRFPSRKREQCRGAAENRR